MNTATKPGRSGEPGQHSRCGDHCKCWYEGGCCHRCNQYGKRGQNVKPGQHSGCGDHCNCWYAVGCCHRCGQHGKALPDGVFMNHCACWYLGGCCHQCGQRGESDFQQQINNLKLKNEILSAKVKALKERNACPIIDQEAVLIKLAKEVKALPIDGINFGFFGLTSTGKSSIINSLLGEKVAAIGAAETTMEVQPFQFGNYTLYDIPGRNGETTYFSEKYISLLKGLTHRLVIITDTVHEMIQLFRLLDGINLTYDIIINKFDGVDLEGRNSFKEKIRVEIQQFSLKSVKHVWFLSAKNPDQFPDWLRMVDFITSAN